MQALRPPRPQSGMLRLDPEQLGKVHDTTVTAYRKAVEPFLEWLIHEGYEPVQISIESGKQTEILFSATNQIELSVPSTRPF